MDIYEGETIKIEMQNFVASSGFVDFTSTDFKSVEWRQDNVCLILEVNRKIEQGALIQVTIRPDAIQLPETGVLRRSILISTGAVSGPVEPVSMVFTPIGSFTSTPSLHFSVARARELTDIDIQFRATMPLEKGETVYVVLPGFSRKGFDLTSTGGSQSVQNLEIGGGLADVSPDLAIRRATWSDTNENLILYIDKHVPANTQVSVKVTKSHASGPMLQMPLRGVRTNDPGIAISSYAKAGIVLNTPIQNFPPVGYFETSDISFDTAKAGAMSNIDISFAALMNVKSREAVVIGLPGLKYSDSISDVVDISDSVWGVRDLFHPTWNRSTGEIVLEARQNVAAGRTIHLRISNFTLPDAGIQSNFLFCTFPVSPYPKVFRSECLAGERSTCECEECPLMQCNAENAGDALQSCKGLPYLRTLAEDGPVLPTRFKVVQAVGSLDKANVDYGPMRAGDVIEFNFSFVPGLPLNVGDSLVLYLQGFRGSPITNKRLPGTHNFGNVTYEPSSSSEFAKLTIVVWPECVSAGKASQVLWRFPS